MNEEIFVINENFVIIGAMIDDIYAKSINWMRKENASIIEKEEPDYIKAYHTGWKYASKYMVKYIVIKLEQKQSTVNIDFKIPHIPSVLPDGGYWTHWWPILYNYCNFVGVDINQIEEKIEKMLSKEDMIWLKPK